MENDFGLICPNTFVDGEEYLLKDWLQDQPALIPMMVVAYDPCPAFVIVCNGSGRQRYLWDDLFIHPGATAVHFGKSVEG